MRYIQRYLVNLVVRVDFQLDSASVPNSRGTRSRHGKALTRTHELEIFLNGFLKIENWFYTLTGTHELEKIFNGFNKKRKLVIHSYKDP